MGSNTESNKIAIISKALCSFILIQWHNELHITLKYIYF